MPYSFKSDNNSGICREILDFISENNVGQNEPYGEDKHCKDATNLINNACALPEKTPVYFAPSGSMANMLGCTAVLGIKNGGTIMSPDDGHLLAHEHDAMKNLGYSLLSVETENGKLTPELLDSALDKQEVKPGAIYFSQTTDRGTVYSKEEFGSIIRWSRRKRILSLVDGARMANACASEKTNFTLQDLGELKPDIFWLGGTKNGGEHGEAMVFPNNELAIGFTGLMKSMGALESKSWVMGVQFKRFFQPEANGDTLWLRAARHANTQANTIYEGLLKSGITFHFKGGGTNILFPIFPNRVLEQLHAKYTFDLPAKKIAEDTSRVRLVCSWDTPPAIAESFISDVREYLLK